jgi:hypothetical protein
MRQKKWTASQQRRNMAFGWSDEKVRKKAAVASGQAEPSWSARRKNTIFGRKDQAIWAYKLEDDMLNTTDELLAKVEETSRRIGAKFENQ